MFRHPEYSFNYGGFFQYINFDSFIRHPCNFTSPNANFDKNYGKASEKGIDINCCDIANNGFHRNGLQSFL